MAKLTEEQYKEKSEKIIQRINESIKIRGGLSVTLGAFGDMKDCNGIVEKIITPVGGGRLTKFWGNDYLFKGDALMKILDHIGLGKALLSVYPRDIVLKSPLFTLSVLLTYVFNKKKFWRFANIYTVNMWWHCVNNARIPKSHYNKLGRELQRCTDFIIEKQIGKVDNKLLFKRSDFIDKYNEYAFIKCLSEFSILFLEYDNAYRLRLQDIIRYLNKENVEKSVIKEIKRLTDILISREVGGGRENSLRNKWRKLRTMILWPLRLNKKYKQMAKDFLLELDLDKVGPDKYDEYYMLKRKGYNFGGRNLKERLAIKEEIDEEHGHVELNLKLNTNEQGRKENAIHQNKINEVSNAIHVDSNQLLGVEARGYN